MKIYHKLLLGFLSVALLVALVGAISIKANKRIAINIVQLTESSIDEARGATEMTFALQTLQYTIQELITNQYREMSLAPSTRRLNANKDKLDDSFDTAIAGFEQWMDFSIEATMKGVKFAEMMDDFKEMEEEQKEIDILENKAQLFSQYKQALSQFKQLIYKDIASAYNVKITQIDPLYQKILSGVNDFEVESEGELTIKGNQIKLATTNANQLLITVTISALILAFILGVTISRLISKPMVQLSEAALKIGSGQLHTRIETHRKDEFGILARSFNHMVNEVQTATQSLQNAASYNNNIVQSMQDTLLVLSSCGEIQRANLSSFKLLGYKKDELIGMSATKILAKGEHFFSTTDIKNLLSTGGVSSTEIFYKTKSKCMLPMLFSAAIMHDKLGKIQGLVCVAQDLSERKLADEKIKESNEKLVEANKELMNTQGQLVHSAKLASVGEMATGVAHELNQPLSIISMNADLQLSEIKENNFSQIEESYQLILNQVNRATTIINHLRTFGRDSNTLAHNLCSINQIIDDSFIMIAEQLRLHNIKVVKNLGQFLSAINCNHIQIEQVLTNLLMNAKDALEHSTDKIITIRSYETGPHIIVEVEDTGSGISHSDLENIFDPFYTSKEVGKGTGLGLSISYGIAIDHSGNLTAESRLGEGSTFRLELPAQRA